jgi:hypothetical protein
MRIFLTLLLDFLGRRSLLAGLQEDVDPVHLLHGYDGRHNGHLQLVQPSTK